MSNRTWRAGISAAFASCRSCSITSVAFCRASFCCLPPLERASTFRDASRRRFFVFSVESSVWLADGQKRIAIRPAEREHAEAIGELLLGVVVETGEKLHLLGAGAMVDGIVKDEHVDALRLSQGSERGMNDGGGKLRREPAPVDSARVHEAVERILAERHSGVLEMHLRVDGTLLEHHAENQQEDAEDRDAAKLVRICRTEDATDLIATEKDLHFLRKQFLVLVVLCYTVHSMSLHWMFFV